MHAIILAAGVGERLGRASGGRPKCLLEINGRSLLARHVESLRALGIEGVSVVAGYEKDQVEEELKRFNGAGEIDILFNPDYRSGSIVSLGAAEPVLESGRGVLLMDADVLYHPDILGALVKSPHANCLLIDRNFEPGDEPVKVCIKGGRIVEFRKGPAADLEFDMQGESVGFFRFDAGTASALARQTRLYVEGGRRAEPYEEAIRDLLLDSPGLFGWEDITGLPWIEIDFPTDVKRAREEIAAHVN